MFFNIPVAKPDNAVPLILPTVVAFPTLVTSPVKFALVVTVAALPPILKLATGVVEVTTNGAVPIATVEVNCVPVIPEAEVIAPDVFTLVTDALPS